jgi:Domain of unknown function (DUF4159)
MRSLSFVGAVLLLAGSPVAMAEEPLPDRVKNAIDGGVRFLEQLENGKGNLEHTSVALAAIRPGGLTALGVLALFEAGAPPQNPTVARCLKYLRALPPKQSYTVGLQTAVFCLTGEKQDRPLIQRNLAWIAKMRVKEGWGYEARFKNSPDHSINEYILLGVHEAWRVGFQVDPKLLEEVHQLYAENTDGEWKYRNQRVPSLSMTAAGLFNLLVTGEDGARPRKLLANGSDPLCGKYSDEKVVQGGIDFLGKHFPDDIAQAALKFPHPFYSLHGMQRAGERTGYRFLGGKDWYRIGCEYLVKTQKPNGSWDGGNRGLDRWPAVATSLSLLFLVRGRTPVLVAELGFGKIMKQQRLGWDSKRNDARHLVEYASRELFAEQLKQRSSRRGLAWQVFRSQHLKHLKPPALAGELLKSRLVYISGHWPKGGLTNQEEAVIKIYLAKGGFIFADNCCNSKPFDSAFRKLIKKVTGKDLVPLKKDHAVFSTRFPVDSREYPLEGIQTNGRATVVYCPRALSGYYENNDTSSEKGKKAFHVAANVIAYAGGKRLPGPRP